MKKLCLIFLLVSLCGMSFAQAGYFSGTAQSTQHVNGQPAVKPLPGASVFVCTYPGSCTVASAATIYTDATAGTLAPNPFNADDQSNFGFWALAGNYQYVITYKNSTFGPYIASIGGGGSGSVPDATSVTKGKLKLTNDLGGTADSPTVPGLANKASKISTQINVLEASVTGDGSTDDTTAFAAIFSTLRSTGGHVIVPAGLNIKLSSAVQLAPGPGQSTNRVTLECLGGYNASKFTWFGTDQTAMLVIGDSTNYGTVTVKGCGFQGSDSSHKAIATSINDAAGSAVSVGIEGNYFGSNLYRGIRAANTWLGWIEHNRFFGPVTDLEFGGGSNTGPVNGYTVQMNEFGAGFTEHAIYTHTNNASSGNTYGPNSIENDNTPFLAAVDLSDTLSTFTTGYQELSNQISVNTIVVRGQYNKLNLLAPTCVNMAGADNTINATAWQVACVGQTYAFNDTAGYNTYIGVSPAAVNNTGGANNYLASARGVPSLDVGSLKSYRYTIGTAYDWANGRVDAGGITFGKSASSNANPSNPISFGTAAVIPFGTIIANSSLLYAPTSPRDNNVFWICATSPNCNANPITASEWRRFGETSSKVRQENTSAPGSGAWTVGDFVWNTNGTTGIIGWYCTVAGTPGTWVAVNAWQVGTTSGTVAAGDDSRITGAVPNSRTVAGKALSSDITLASSDLSDGSNVVKTNASATLGAFTYDFSGAAHTIASKVGIAASKPGTCTVGEVYFATDATAGQNWYFCTATNTWTQQLNTGGGGSGTISSGTINQVPYYSAATTLSGDAGMTYDPATDTLTVGSLITNGTAGADTITLVAAPASPAAGKLATYGDSTDLRFHDKNASGVIGTTVVADSGASNNFVTAISVAGAISKARPTWANIDKTTSSIADLATRTCATLSDSGTGCSATISSYAPLASPTFTGTPSLPTGTTATTQSAADNSTKLATTAYADAVILTKYKTRQCEMAWGGSGTSFALTSGDDSVANNSCYNKTGTTWTITGVYCKSDVGSNTTTVNPTYGAAGTGTSILTGALTCGSSEAYSATGTISGTPTIADGNGIRPVMGGTLTGTNIHVLVVYTY